VATIVKKRLVRNVSSLFFVQIANYVLPLASIPIVVRIIGPDNFGLINYAGAIVAYFTLLINYSFNLTATREVAQHVNDRQFINKIFAEVLGAKLFLFIIASLVFVLATIFIPAIRNAWQVMWFTFLICIAWIFTPDWLFQGMQQLHRIAYFNLATKLIFTILILLIIREKNDYYWQPFAISSAQVLIAIFSWYYAIKKFQIEIYLPKFQKVFNILWKDRTLFFSSVVISLYTTTNTVILGFLSNATEVGYYTAALRFTTVAQALISVPLAQTLFPYISQSFGISKEHGLQTVRKIAPFIIGITFICGALMWVFGPWVISQFYGDAFFPAQGMFRVMAFTPFIITLSNLFAIQVMINLHMNKAIFHITLAGAVLSLLLNSVLTWKLGGLGTSYATLITECFITLSSGLYLSSQKINIIQIHSFHPIALSKKAKLFIADIRK